MFDIIELNGKKVAELREIAGKLGIARTDKLKKQDLVYSILDEQAAQPGKAKSSSSDADSKKTTRKRGAKSADDKSSGDATASKSNGRRKKKSEEQPAAHSMRDCRSLRELRGDQKAASPAAPSLASH